MVELRYTYIKILAGQTFGGFITKHVATDKIILQSRLTMTVERVG